MLGTLLKKIREEQRYTQTLLARKCGLSRSALWKIENNIQEPNISTLTTICKVLGVSPAIFFEKNEDNNQHLEAV